MFKINNSSFFERSFRYLLELALATSSHRKCSIETSLFKNVAKFKKIHLRQSLFFFLLLQLQVSMSNFIKKEILTQVFSCEFSKVSQNKFFTKHLQPTDLLLSFSCYSPKFCLKIPLFIIACLQYN